MKSTNGNPIVRIAFLLIVAGLVFYYGWISAPFVERYTTGAYGAEHPWFSTEQVFRVQFLFLVAILTGAAVQLSLNPSAKLARVRDKWNVANAVIAFLLMELPYIAEGILDLIYWPRLSEGFHPIYNCVPFSVYLRFGIGDFMVSSLAAVWLGISFVNIWWRLPEGDCKNLRRGEP